MNVTDDHIKEIVDRVVDKLSAVAGAAENKPASQTGLSACVSRHEPESAFSSGTGERGSFPDVASACQAAQNAFLAYRDVAVEQRKKIIAAIREICLDHLQELARLAVVETGLGRVEDKLKKNRLVIEKTPGVEDLELEAFSGDDGLTIQERAPFGVIGSITPCTNPSETIICNGIGMIAGGNTVVFNPHPSAKKISVYTVNLLNKAVISEGGPPHLFTTVANPTIESAQNLMKHPGIRLLVVTGGPAVVSVAMKSGKRVIAAGPGNPPVVVDETADLEKAAREIVTSASCDNNIICVVEKEIIVTSGAAVGLKKALLKAGAVELGDHQARRLEKIILTEDGHPNRAWVDPAADRHGCFA
jgi:acyl-CoA reductase-like NAD-dependent aldehyde dehydrogenase